MTAPGTRTACPSCGARLRPEAAFCGQCYADFRPPPPVAPPAPAAAAGYGTAVPDPLTAPLLDVVLPVAALPVQASAPVAEAPAKPSGWPCSRCGTFNDFAAAICHQCSSPFLAQVAEEGKVTIVLPGVGDISRYGRGQRAALALGALLVLLVPLALITLLLTKSPPDSGRPSVTSVTTEAPLPETSPGG